MKSDIKRSCRRIAGPCLLLLGTASITEISAQASLGFRGGSQQDRIHVSVNGEPVAFTGIGPQQVQGRVMVPLRGVLEKLGAFVDWVPSTRSVVASRGNMDLELQIGSRSARVNGKEVTLDVPAMTLGGSTMVPLRFVGETLGADIRWDGVNQTVLITTNEATIPDEPGRGRGRTLPANANEPVRNPVPVALAVTSLTHNRPSGWMRAGEVLTVRMRGTPGAKGSFRIPGVVEAVPLQEVSPGVYEGSWIVPADKSLDISEAAVIGSLTGGEGNRQTAPLLQSGNNIQIDTVAPKIADFSPSQGTQVTKAQPLISATFSDQGGSGIAAEKVHILMDGRDVTADSTITGQFFTYTPRQALSNAKHSVDIMAYDQAGNETRRTWTFDVMAPVQAANPNVPSVVGIKTIQTNAAGELKPGDVLDVRIVGPSGGNATWSLGPIKDQELKEVDSTGAYVGSYRLRSGDDMENARLTATIVMPGGKKFTDTFGKMVKVSSGTPIAPVITSPGPDGAFSGPLVVRGTATPNSLVRIKVDYNSRALGVLGVKGTVAQQEIKVGPDGKWASTPIELSSLFGRRDTQYTLTAYTVTPTDERSPITTLRIK